MLGTYFKTFENLSFFQNLNILFVPTLSAIKIGFKLLSNRKNSSLLPDKILLNEKLVFYFNSIKINVQFKIQLFLMCKLRSCVCRQFSAFRLSWYFGFPGILTVKTGPTQNSASELLNFWKTCSENSEIIVIFGHFENFKNRPPYIGRVYDVLNDEIAWIH